MCVCERVQPPYTKTAKPPPKELSSYTLVSDKQMQFRLFAQKYSQKLSDFSFAVGYKEYV